MFHLLLPGSKHLFRYAIMQSNPAAYTYPSYQQADKIATKKAVKLGCETSNDVLKCLRYEVCEYHR